MDPTWQQQVLDLKQSDKIFKVFARADATTPEDEWQHIANIFAKTDFRTSNWADERLHFNHLNVVFDNNLKPASWFSHS